MSQSDLETLSEARCYGGVQGIYRHASKQLDCDMHFSVFTPPQAASGPLPVLTFLSGLTCSEENFTVKAGAQRYVADELPALIAANFPVDLSRQGITGHSMGGHGALTIAFAHPDRYRSLSAFAPIVAPMHCPWGVKAFTGYLGTDRERWKRWDACELAASTSWSSEILIDQGSEDPFLETQLMPERFEQACSSAGIPLNLRRQSGYDHSYYFIASFLEDHFAHHAKLLCD